VDVLFGGLPATVEHVRAGRLRALAVTTATRSQALPDIPTVGEFLPGYEASAWYGIGAPKNTPTEIIDKLNREINLSLADPKIMTRFAKLGFTPLLGSPADFGRLVARGDREVGQSRQSHRCQG
jgi:tripartite-type tricarboxylate transporter receptor subunit TctC